MVQSRIKLWHSYKKPKNLAPKEDNFKDLHILQFKMWMIKN